MISERRLREIVALLEQHQRHDALVLFEKKSGDFNLILDVLLRSYSETCDESFFSHFYSLTVPIIVGDVKRYLDEEGVSANPEEFIADIYEAVLRLEDTGSVRRDDRVLYHCSAIAAQVVHLRKMKCADVERDEQLTEFPSVADRPVVGQPVRMEEERRAGLLVARIRELVFGGRLGLNAREKRILGHFYRDGLTSSEVAAAMETSLQEVSDTLFRVKRRAQEMLMHSHDTHDSGEANL